MKPGDILTCNNNMRWVLVEEYETTIKVIDFHTHQFETVLDKKLIMSKEELKVEWLFLARKKRNLKGLEKYV